MTCYEASSDGHKLRENCLVGYYGEGLPRCEVV